MALSDSPTLENYKNGLPQKPQDTSRKKRAVQIIIIILLLLAIVLGAYDVLSSRDVALLTGKGSLSGQVVDDNGQGLQTTVFVFGVDKPVETDADGHFIYENVPAGTRMLIVTHNGYAAEYPVQVTAGNTTDIGQITFKVVTPEPQE